MSQRNMKFDQEEESSKRYPRRNTRNSMPNDFLSPSKPRDLFNQFQSSEIQYRILEFDAEC